jgi:alkylated DNA repair dioxygenase AlkB
MEGAEVWYCDNYFSEHKLWYELINDSVNWENFPVKMMGKIMDQPRLSFYMADDNKHPYKYAGFDRIPNKWTIGVNEIKKELNNMILNFNPKHPDLNAVLGNKYEDGTRYISEHSDDEKDLVKNAYIISVSLGAKRDFIFKNKHTGEKITIQLEPGSVLLMGGECQKNWKHSLPKRLKVKDARINLTFRSIIPRI